jgi:CDP-Glycerol:Poly(glycerophosphate) glycerophosphotransferase
VFSELFIIKQIDAGLLKTLWDRFPKSRTVYWDGSAQEAEVIAEAAAFANNVLGSQSVCEELNGIVSVDPVDKFAPELAPLFESAEKNKKEPSSGRPVLFCPSNDTHVKMFAPIAGHLESSRFLLFDRHPGENSRAMAQQLGLTFEEGNAHSLGSINPSVIVFGNDWYPDAWRLIAQAHRLGIPTVCLQEGCLDFQRQRRMQWSDISFVQGPIVPDHFPQKLFFVTGNPRFDELRPAPAPQNPMAMINSNFTYGVFENTRDNWVRGAADSCRMAGIPCFVSQHPRDKGNFPDLEVRGSGAGLVHDQLRESTVVVTRFSTLIYEALLLGRQAIYYNPHGEDMRLFNEDRTGGIFVARNEDELVVALQETQKNGGEPGREARDRFIRLHCRAQDGQSAKRVAEALERVSILGKSLAGASVAERLAFRTVTGLRSLPLITRLFK